MSGNRDRRGVARMDVSGEPGRAGSGYPDGHRIGGLTGVSVALVGRRHRPRELGRHPPVPVRQCGLDRAHRFAALAVAEHPVEPSLRPVRRVPGDLPRIPRPERAARGRLAAGVLVQRPIVKDREHLVGVIGSQRLEREAGGLDPFRMRPAHRINIGRSASGLHAPSLSAIPRAARCVEPLRCIGAIATQCCGV